MNLVMLLSIAVTWLIRDSFLFFSFYLYTSLKFFNKGDKNQSKFIKNLFILNLKSISIKRSSSVNDSIKSYSNSLIQIASI